MKTLSLFCIAALGAVSLPVQAQTTPAPDDAAQESLPTDPAAGASQPANAASQVAAVVEQGFPTYDADGSGSLNKAEFSKWVLDLKAQELKATGKTMPQGELKAWAAASFAMADADADAAVTRAELTRYLGG